MSACFIDITIEFLAIAFHNILFYMSVYPESVFETRRKYGVVVHRCFHPEVNQYIDLSLKSLKECLKNGQLSRIVLAITDGSYKPYARFIFDVSKNSDFDETKDAYLILTEQNLRAFCLALSSMSLKIMTESVDEDRSFTLYLHTNESTAVAVATNPDLEDFPLVEVEEKNEEIERILPLRRFSIQNFNLDTYIEIK